MQLYHSQIIYLEDSRRMFVVKGCRGLPCEIILSIVYFDITDNDKLEGESRLVEPGIRFKMIQLDIHLREDKN